ncbi:MAG: hypothetical protein ABFS17_09840, partial [Chloroflexota bacterium]
AVSSLPVEGQYLPETADLMGNHPWKPETKMPWDKIKPIWESYWDLEKPLLVEKSPPNLMRAPEIVKYFYPVYFLIMVRNPYALCEGFMRRTGDNPRRAAKKTIKLLKRQAENARTLENSISFTYEDLTNNPKKIVEKIEAFIPQLGSLDHQGEFKVHSIDGMVTREIVNFNQKKINNLSPKHFDVINKIFKKNLEALDHWGYKLYIPPRNHLITFLITRARVFIPTLRMRTAKKIKSLLNK